MDYSDPEAVRERIASLDEIHPGWRTATHPNGQRQWSDKGMLLNDCGTRSIFDDVDE